MSPRVSVPAVVEGMPTAVADARSLPWSPASRTWAVRLVLAVSLVPLRTAVPLPRTVTVRLTVWLVSDVTDGRVQVGVAALGSSSVPPFTLQSYSTAPS